jgi:hypothetical protein
MDIRGLARPVDVFEVEAVDGGAGLQGREDPS